MLHDVPGQSVSFISEVYSHYPVEAVTFVMDNGGGSATMAFRDVADTKNRVEMGMQNSEKIDITLDGG